MKNKIQLISLVFFFLMGASGCNKPGFQQSGIKTPFTWKTTEDLSLEAEVVVDDRSRVDQLWWKQFKDKTLNDLIDIAFQNNKDLAIALTRIQEARAARLKTWSLFFPQITVMGDASKGNQGFFTSGKIYRFTDTTVQATWEVDLFGKNLANYDAKDSEVQAAIIDRQAVIVSLFAEVARNYFDLRNYERQISITEENIETEMKTLELTKEQLEGGFASDFDVQRAAAQVSTTMARLPVLKNGYAMTTNHINVLLGGTPGEYEAVYKTVEIFSPLDPQIIVSAPATVLRARPDVRAAERHFNATISTEIAAIKEWFPDISLLAYYGFQNMTLFNTIPTWNVVANLVQPIINFGKIQADIATADAEKQRAFLDYQKTVLEALENMENALSSYLNEMVRNASLTNARDENKKALELANQQYENGYTALLDLLVVQRNVLETESAKAESDAYLRKYLVDIYTAAGGGWEY